MQTIPAENIEKSVIGYMVNTDFTPTNQEKIGSLQGRFVEEYRQLIWSQPLSTLHITLMDWIAPLVEYGRNKDELYADISGEYVTVLEDILRNQSPVRVVFNELKVTPGAVILVGHDDGSFERIRTEFLERITLLPDTKQPPKIVHSSICRYSLAQDLEGVEKIGARVDVNFVQEVTSFRLVREELTPMLNYKVVQTFNLG